MVSQDSSQNSITGTAQKTDQKLDSLREGAQMRSICSFLFIFAGRKNPNRTSCEIRKAELLKANRAKHHTEEGYDHQFLREFTSRSGWILRALLYKVRHRNVGIKACKGTLHFTNIWPLDLKLNITSQAYLWSHSLEDMSLGSYTDMSTMLPEDEDWTNRKLV